LAHRGFASKKETLQRLLLPAYLFAPAICAIALFYRVRLGHLPDWRAFFEYARAYQAGFGALFIDPQGTFLFLALAFVVVATGSMRGVGQLFGSTGHARLTVQLATFGLLWAVSSYFVQRSHNNN